MQNPHLNPLLDGDYLIYRVGFAVKDDEPVEYALSTVKHAIHNIWDRFPDATERKLYLSGKNNFRDKLGTILIYKGNRDPSHRPHYYSEIKEYIIKYHNAIVVDGQEADDAVCIEQWKHKDRSTVIVGIDKDLHQCPGWHFNPVRDELKYVTLAEGNAFFFHQMLTGDRTDNIPGIKGLGEIRAAKLLDPCDKDIFKMKDVVMQQYKKQYGSEAENAYHEVSNLLWMRREEGQTCPF